MLMKANVVELVRPGVITNPLAYWATHIGAILVTLADQQRLTYRFYGKTIPEGVPQTLATLCGNAPVNFLKMMDGAIQNFGMQYFLSTYLMSTEGFPCLRQLLEAIGKSRNVDLISPTVSVGVYVCGKDSRSGQAFLANTQAYLFGSNGMTLNEAARQIEYADLCVLLYPQSGEHPIALLGEVEGVRGERLTWPSFWDEKSPHCCFGIGVHRGLRGMSELFTQQLSSGSRTIMRFGSSHHVVSDFHKAITTLISQMSHSRHADLHAEEGLAEVMNLVRHRWNDPIDLLIEELQSMSMLSTMPTEQQMDNLCGLMHVPSIVV
ncbi:hypothetical protein GNZ12_26500 [Paraburkholderia sp. 1N]|uniref:Uncharacterized protein n=1 Tax=Paraburkholderia solitsugae TaxID=2675748 RepID=A0ABX2BXQ0_9BURK|nr:hypothetical protein [Paraburkholderia solitsugae]NPT44803.1 hypothetical protein [Paraburkholderia solitsugae]